MLLDEAHNKSVAGGTTKEEVLAALAAARNVPPHNPFASTASEAYRCLRPTHTSPSDERRSYSKPKWSHVPRGGASDNATQG